MALPAIIAAHHRVSELELIGRAVEEEELHVLADVLVQLRVKDFDQASSSRSALP